jgi:hypothetical protein
VPRALAERFAPVSNRAFYVSWTRAECAAKLNGIPILLWLRRHGLAADSRLCIETVVTGDLVVTTARRPNAGLRDQNIA